MPLNRIAGWATVLLLGAGYSAESQAQNAPLNVSSRAVWAGTMGQSCSGLTMGWHPLLEPLAGLVGTNWQPAPGPIANRGTFMVLTIKCDDSTIDGVLTGPIVVALAIVPVVPYGQPRAAPVTAFTRVVAPSGSPTAGMFRRLGFQVLEGPVDLVFDTRRGVPKATFAIVSGSARITATATFPVGGTDRSTTLSAVGTAPGVFSTLDGRARSRITEGTDGVILNRGTDLFGHLGLEENPPIVELGREYTWEFHLQRGEFEPR